MSKNPKFTVLYEKLRGQSFEIDRDVMSIGRKDGMDICLKDGNVSSHHADIIRTERDGEIIYTLRDNDSTNGTRVNNVPVTEQVLKNSDLIMFGSVEVLFDGAPGAGSSEFTQVTKTIDISNIDTNTATSQTLINFNPLASNDDRKQSMLKNGVTLTYIFMGIVGVALAGLVIFKIFFNAK